MKTSKGVRKLRILDAAEELFSQHGFDGVTLRQIATLANVDVALTNYHFGNKEQLITAVFQRRADILNKVRTEALSECLARSAPNPPTLEEVIDAYLRPLGKIQASADEGWKHYLSLVARVNNSPKWGRRFMSKHFNSFVLQFIDALKTTLPEADEATLYWGYQYLSGALTLTFADTGRLDTLSNGKTSSSDAEFGYEHMAPFIAAGFRAICTNSPKN